MEHHHTEPEELEEQSDLIRDYWRKPQKYEFETDIKEINQEWIRLQESYFYPEGGGQPSDRGKLVFNKNQYFVKDVQEKSNQIWLFVQDHQLQEGMKVHAEIDEYRRKTLSRNHSAQHLLSAAFWEELEFETERALIDLKETEIELNVNPSFDEIETAVEVAEKYITEQLPINSKLYQPNEIKNRKIRGPVDPDLPIYRFVEIGDYDVNPCGGTHVESTTEIETIFISKIDGKRLKFISGSDARQEIAKKNRILLEVARTLGTSVSDIISSTEELINNKIQLERRINKLEQRITTQKIQSSEWHDINDVQVKIALLNKLDRGQVLEALNELKNNQFALIADSSGTFVLTGENERKVQNMMNKLRERGIKGGGKGNVVMGKLNKIDHENDLFSIFQDLSS